MVRPRTAKEITRNGTCSCFANAYVRRTTSTDSGVPG